MDRINAHAQRLGVRATLVAEKRTGVSTGFLSRRGIFRPLSRSLAAAEGSAVLNFVPAPQLKADNRKSPQIDFRDRYSAI